MSTLPHPAAQRIRVATLADAARLVPLCCQLGYPASVEETSARLAACLAEADHIIFVSENSEGELSGWADVVVLRTLASDPRAEVQGLVVDEHFRSRGVGACLMARVEEWARTKGCSAVTLRSNVIRERAHEFYGRLGYTCIKTQKSYRKAV